MGRTPSWRQFTGLLLIGPLAARSAQIRAIMLGPAYAPRCALGLQARQARPALASSRLTRRVLLCSPPRSLPVPPPPEAQEPPPRDEETKFEQRQRLKDEVRHGAFGVCEGGERGGHEGQAAPAQEGSNNWQRRRKPNEQGELPHATCAARQYGVGMAELPKSDVCLPS
jgi:hypothetical protein